MTVYSHSAAGADVLAALRTGATRVSGSTISAGLSERLTAAHAAAGQQFVTATVLGRPEAVAAGGLFVFAAGPPAAVEPLMPVLDALATPDSEVSGSCWASTSKRIRRAAPRLLFMRNAHHRPADRTEDR